MARFFAIPFGTSAAKTTIPDTDSANVSWSNGYTVLYEYDPTVTGNNAKHVERDVFNTLFYDITSSIQAIQLYGVAPYYDAVIGSGGPGYNEGSLVSYANKTWRSKISGNKIKPNLTTTASWEEVLGYDSLVTKLKNDNLVGSGGGSGSGSGYTKEEIDQIINNLTASMDAYYLKDVGEIFLLTWCDEDRNREGFFLCNGDELPYGNETPTTIEEYYGTVLYSMCYDDGKETDFKKRWDITVDTANKTIALPNILGNADDDYISDEQSVLVALGKTAEIIGSEDSEDSLKMFAREYPVAEATEAGDLVVRVVMLPCVYLGPYDESIESGGE